MTNRSIDNIKYNLLQSWLNEIIIALKNQKNDIRNKKY
jgi:hypothetical protein